MEIDTVAIKDIIDVKISLTKYVFGDDDFGYPFHGKIPYDDTPYEPKKISRKQKKRYKKMLAKDIEVWGIESKCKTKYLRFFISAFGGIVFHFADRRP